MQRLLIRSFVLLICFQPIWAEPLKVVHLVSMSYPRGAADARRKGRTKFKLKILPNGEIGEIRSSGNEALAKAASENLGRWRFASSEKGEKGNIIFDFKLDKEAGWSLDDNGRGNLTVTVKDVRH
jgi:hypothetical protein